MSTILDQALAHHRAGELDQAAPLYEQVLAAEPRNARAAHNLGAIRLSRQDIAGALPLLALAAEQDPDTPQIRATYLRALIAAGLAAYGRGDAAEAEAQFRRAAALDPGHAGPVRSLGVLLTSQGRFEDALAAADVALAAARTPEALIVRGDALHGLGRLEAALAAYAEAAQAGADRHEMLLKTGVVHASLRQYEAAFAALDAAVAMQPDDPLAYVRRAPIRLMTGDFEGGWADYEARWRHDRFLAASSGLVGAELLARRGVDLDLTPADVAGRRVLVVGEQGIGDQVMFASILPDLAAAAAEVTCVVDRRLVRLLGGSLPQVRVLGAGEAPPLEAFDRVVPMASLGRMFRNRREDFSGAPYLRPSQAAAQRWRDRLGPKTAPLRIGLSWRGGTPATGAARRSLSLDQLSPILDLPAEFVSLQYGEVAADLAGRSIRAFRAADLDDFDDLAGLVATLDVVVSVQTAVVHLAGALGRHCLALVPHDPEWRYGASGEEMAWYRSVRIFRQAAPGDWGPVIEAVAQALLSRGAAAP